MSYFSDIKEFSAWIVGVVVLVIVFIAVFRNGDKLKG